MPWEGKWWIGPLPTLEELHGDRNDLTCESCGASGIPLKVYGVESDREKDSARERGEAPVRFYCHLCASTYTSMMVKYSSHRDPDIVEIARTICFVGNEILKELRRSREE